MFFAEEIIQLRNNFLNDSINISEKNVNILKNHYYIWAKQLIDIERIEYFRIGTSRNKNLLWFNNINYPNKHLILYINENKYKIIEKDFTKINKQQNEQELDVPATINSPISLKRKEKLNLIDKSKINCCKRCKIL